MVVPEPIKLKNGQYRIQLRLDGRSVMVYGDTKAECKKAALDKKLHKPKKTITLGEALDKYIDDRREVLSPSTIRGYSYIKRNRLQAYMDKPLQQDWQAIMNAEAKNLAPKTVKNIWGVIYPILKENGIEAKITLPQVVRKEKEFLQPEDIKKYIELARGTELEVPIILALHSLRRSEIYSMTADKIRDGIIHVQGASVYDENYLWVSKEENKTASSRRDIPVMIPFEFKPITMAPNTLTYKVKKFSEDNGFGSVGLHGLRHSFASLCYYLGIGELEAMKLGGWSDFSTMRKIYTHLSDVSKTEAANKLKGFFEA